VVSERAELLNLGRLKGEEREAIPGLLAGSLRGSGSQERAGFRPNFPVVGWEGNVGLEKVRW
jgi:hypothetical protein